MQRLDPRVRVDAVPTRQPRDVGAVRRLLGGEAARAEGGGDERVAGRGALLRGHGTHGGEEVTLRVAQRVEESERAWV